MSAKHIKPVSYLYNLLLRTTKECGIGDESFAHDIVLACMSVKEAREHRKKLLKQGNDKEEVKLKFTEILGSSLSLVENTSALTSKKELPNLLDKKPNFDNIVSVGSLDRPQDRFQLIGGVDGFCHDMIKNNQIQPDIKTFTMMLDLIDDTEEAENTLINKMSEFNVTPNTTFLNMLIRRRVFRKDYDLARDTLQLFNKYACEVDLISFGVLAMTCSKSAQMKEFLAVRL